MSLISSSINTDAKEKNTFNANAGVTTIFSETMEKINKKDSSNENSHFQTTSAGINDELLSTVEGILNESTTSAGVTHKLADILSNSYHLVKSSNENIKEKQYYDFPCTEEFQDYIFKISTEASIPFEIMMTILHQESDGQWNSNGVISATGDYGMAQINICNHEEIKANTGITTDELLYDPYQAVKAEAYQLKKIMNLYGYTKDNYNYENIFGTYNGWIYWYYDESALTYVDSCMEILQEKFGNKERILK